MRGFVSGQTLCPLKASPQKTQTKMTFENARDKSVRCAVDLGDNPGGKEKE